MSTQKDPFNIVGLTCITNKNSFYFTFIKSLLYPTYILLGSKISQGMFQCPKYYKFKKKNPFRPSKKGQGPLKISERMSKPMNGQALSLRK